MIDNIFVIFIGVIVITVGLLLISNFNMNLKKWVFLMIILFYGVLFVFVFLVKNIGENNISTETNLCNISWSELILYLCAVLLLYLGIGVGYKVKTKESGLINIRNEIFLDDSELFWNKLFNFSLIMLFISFVAYYLYARAYGGFDGLLSYTMLIRNGFSQISNRWSFLQKFGSFSHIAGFCLFSIMTSKLNTNHRRRVACFFWILSFSFSIYVIYSQGGRGAIVNVILVYILAVGFKKTKNLIRMIKKHWVKFISIPVAFLVMNSAWNRASVTSLFRFIANGYEYLFSSFFVNLHNFDFRYFIDLIYMPLMLLPSSIYRRWGITTANQFNTFLTQGGYKGSVVDGSLITGESTTGLLSFSYMQLSFIGVFVIAMIYGICLKKWNRRLEVMPDNSFKDIIRAYYIVYFVYLGVGGGDTSALVIVNFAYLVFFFLFHIYYKISK